MERRDDGETIKSLVGSVDMILSTKGGMEEKVDILQ